MVRVSLARARAGDRTLAVLREISDGIKQLEKKFDRLIKLQEALAGGDSVSSPSSLPFDIESIVSLPDHLARTAMVIARIREGTAYDVSRLTGRARAAESDYLNQLAGLGYLKKRRVMRKVVFYIGT